MASTCVVTPATSWRRRDEDRNEDEDPPPLPPPAPVPGPFENRAEVARQGPFRRGEVTALDLPQGRKDLARQLLGAAGVDQQFLDGQPLELTQQRRGIEVGNGLAATRQALQQAARTGRLRCAGSVWIP